VINQVRSGDLALSGEQMADKLRLDFQFPSHWKALHRFIIARLARSYEAYQPVRIGDRQLADGARTCLDRWSHIETILQRTNAKSLLDLGCAEGYFVQQAARHGCIGLGVDADMRRLTIAQNTSILNGVSGAGFLYGQISVDFIEALPSFDVVLFLSVLHHVIHAQGIDYAAQIMTSILQRTRLGLVFDMGQSNENRPPNDWSRILPPMEPDPKTWITNFLKDVGFSEVEVLADTDAFATVERRHLFFCRP
jgi:SAM-dependent methyltransferase